MEIVIVCFSCKKEFDYFLSNICPNCKEIIEIDPSIKDVFVFLNVLGIKTDKSCEGHSGDVFHNFPWVSFINDQKQLNKIIRLIDFYNQTKPEHEWEVRLNVSGKCYWLVPVTRNTTRIEELQKSLIELAEFLRKETEK